MRWAWWWIEQALRVFRRRVERYMAERDLGRPGPLPWRGEPVGAGSATEGGSLETFT